MAKGEEILRQAMGLGMPEGYPVLVEDHPFLHRLAQFMSTRKRWIGTASDLIFEMNDTFTPPNTAAKLLRRYCYRLYRNHGLDVSFYRTNRKRIIEICHRQ